MTSESGSGDDVDGGDTRRFKFIPQCWDRNPILRRGEAPLGCRTPNGHVWGHTLDDFFWVERVP